MRQVSSYKIEDFFKQLSDDINKGLNSHRIGSIKSFNPNTQRAEVQIVDLFTDTTYEVTQGIITYIPAILADVPVHINATINGGITIPINIGDFCLIEFNDRDISNWKISDKVEGIELASYRLHSLSDGVAIVGLFQNANPLLNYNNNATEIFYKINSRISLQETFINATNGTSTINIGSKIDITNSAGHLGALIGDLIDIIAGLQTTPTIPGVPATLDPGVISQLNTIKGTIQNLLT